jgi:hypothetical protein
MTKQDERFPATLVLEPVSLDDASPAFRRFYEIHFVDTLPLLRGDEDWTFAKKLTPRELALARRLLRANMHVDRCYADSAALLNDDAICERLRSSTSRASFLVRSPTFPG